ncbi:MAG: OmpA family protein [Marinifilaceae bacterium]|jgi:outer membrane protein OmpA-like peptidoglycan-associated protein/tetratricopeptide (TPR) repeat protein|nr:OmpA family protein [Marinifilaceae bacterium]
MISNINKLILALILLFVSFNSLNAQWKRRANKEFQQFDYIKAIRHYESLIKKDSTDKKLIYNLAEACRKVNNYEKAELYYHKFISLDSAMNDNIAYYHYSRALQSNGKYSEAKIWMDKFLTLIDSAELKGIGTEFSMIEKQQINSIKIFPLTINSLESDFGVAYYKDGIVFSSAAPNPKAVKRHSWNDQNFLRLYYGEFDEKGDVKAKKVFSEKLERNYHLHDGPVCFSPDMNTVYITRNHIYRGVRAKKNKKGVVSLKLYKSSFNGLNWSVPKLMDINMDEYSSGQPSLSADGQKLYFVSDRPGGYGGTDIYVCRKEGDSWSEPRNLGERINTSDDEMMPFVTENEILYFSSKAHTGYGGLDIFNIDLNNPNSRVENLGKPINSEKDDFGLVLKNSRGYFASNRTRGESYDDIYCFDIHEFIITGQVLNSKNKEYIPNANLKVKKGDGTAVVELITDSLGRFKLQLPVNKDYHLKASKNKFNPGENNILSNEFAGRFSIHKEVFLTPKPDINLRIDVVYEDTGKPVEDVNTNIVNLLTSDTTKLLTDANGHVDFKMNQDTDYEIIYNKKGIFRANDFVTSKGADEDIEILKEVRRMEIGTRFVLENIFYDLNKSNIRPDAALELDKLVKLMIENPTMSIELSSHTDCRGSDSYNMRLSDRRAHSAVRYIISKGVSSKRLRAKGYGETRLINKCANGVPCPEEEHQANRRTEVEILKL